MNFRASSYIQRPEELLEMADQFKLHLRDSYDPWIYKNGYKYAEIQVSVNVLKWFLSSRGEKAIRKQFDLIGVDLDPDEFEIVDIRKSPVRLDLFFILIRCEKRKVTKVLEEMTVGMEYPRKQIYGRNLKDFSFGDLKEEDTEAI